MRVSMWITAEIKEKEASSRAFQIEGGLIYANSVTYELTVFGGRAAGVIIAFLYDMFRLKRRMVKPKPLWFTLRT